MSTSGQDDGSSLFPIARQSDFPANTVAGMANEIQNNGYTMALMNGDLAYAECAFPPSMPWRVMSGTLSAQIVMYTSKQTCALSA